MIQNKIISWYLKNKRTLPWRNTQNPYFIWLSEIILQQTRVAQGLPYYEKFTEKYPSVFDLANAPEEEVLRLWQGLGYYSRGRNLHATARYIAGELAGRFPQTHSRLVRLKGVGDYTAAAIASFAFKEKVPAIDGNVIRVISRLYAIDQPVDLPSTLQEIRRISVDLISSAEPDLYNQAMMEFGAMLCTPKNPGCDICPVQAECLSFPGRDFLRIPYKSRKTKVLERSLHYLVLEHGGNFFMKQRTGSDIWQNLFDFPETTPEELPALLRSLNAGPARTFPPVTHILSHRKLTIRFTHCGLPDPGIVLEGAWFTPEEAERLAKPKVIVDFFSRIHAE